MKTAPLQIALEEPRPGVFVIKLEGKAMLAGTAVIEERISELVQQGHKKIVVDLTGVTHIDSTGIGRFIASLGKVNAAGGALLMAGAGGMVREGFRVTRLDRIFRFYPDVASALAAV